MSLLIDLKLFPKNEAWATGDEALDHSLSVKLAATANDLTFESIRQFYLYGMKLKIRAYNPLFKINVELVVKALLFYLSPNDYNDDLFKKVKGNYFAKEIIEFDLEKSDIILDGLKMLRRFRFENQLDFFLEEQLQVDRNPYVLGEIKRNPYQLSAKAIFKDLTNFLNETKVDQENKYSHTFFQKLRGGKNILVVKNLGEFWFHDDLIYSNYLDH